MADPDFSSYGLTPVKRKSVSEKPDFKSYGLTAGQPDDEEEKKPKNEYIPSPLFGDIGDPSESLKGFAQGAENVGIGMANLIPGVNIPKQHWAGDSQGARYGELGADIGSYLIPGKLFAGGLKAASKIPQIGNALKASVKGLEHRPFLNALAKLLKGTGEGAASGAILSDKEGQGEGAQTGAEWGAGTNVLSQLLRVRNPILNALVRAGAGAGGGLVANELGDLKHPYQAASYGAGLGIVAPNALKSLGLRGGPAGLETLEHLNPEEVSPALQAGNRLGTPITPAEASGNPFVGGIEGRYGRTGEAAAEKTRIGQGRVVKQNEAISDLLDTIHDKSTPEAAAASKQKITDLYEQAYKWNVQPKEIAEFREDPVVNAAFERVESDPAYQRKLKGIPQRNYAYLNQVKRALSDMEGSALKAGESDRADEFKAARKDLVSRMDEMVPEYAQARQEAQKSIIRSNIQKMMRKKELKGSTFFNTVLKNEDEFNKLHDSLKNVPEAQDKLKDMRLAWKNLIDIEKPKNKAFREETGLNQSRNWASKIVDMWNEMTGSKRNIAALRFIHSPDWDKGFRKIGQIKDLEKRKDAIADIIAKLVSAHGTATSQGKSE